MQHMVFTMLVYLQKYVYIVQLQITNALLSSISFHPSHSSSRVDCSFHENPFTYPIHVPMKTFLFVRS